MHSITSMGRMAICLCVMTVLVVLTGCQHTIASDTPARPPITEADVNAAQQAWCDGLVLISETYRAGGDYVAVAETVIDNLYDYNEGVVFFKPTLAFGPNTFRSTRESALAYFVGGNDAFPEDSGFALNPWVKVYYDNNAAENGIQIHGEIAITMGNVYLVNADGDVTMVDKTFVFRRGSDGNLRLCVHKSALPFQPAPGGAE